MDSSVSGADVVVSVDVTEVVVDGCTTVVGGAFVCGVDAVGPAHADAARLTANRDMMSLCLMFMASVEHVVSEGFLRNSDWAGAWLFEPSQLGLHTLAPYLHASGSRQVESN